MRGGGYKMAFEENKLAKRNSGMPVKSADETSEFLSAILGTTEVKQLVGRILPPFLKAWAGKNTIRKMIASVAGKVVGSGFATGKGAEPDISIAECLKAYECSGRAGILLTSILKNLNETYATDPTFLSEKLRPTIRELIRNIDFGELKEVADRLSNDAGSISSAVNEELWEYPAKVVTLLSVLPSVFNALIRSANSTLGPMNRLPPDLLADVLLSLVRDIKAEDLGRLTNEICELIRKTHTGSVLTGDAGKPRLPADISELAAKILQSTNIELLIKARLLMADITESIEDAVLNRLRDHPALVREIIAEKFRKLGTSSRRLGLLLELMDDTLSEEQVVGEITTGIAQTDVQEIAGSLNRMIEIFNSVNRKSPGIVRNLMSQAVDSLDSNEAKEAVEVVVSDTVAALKPLAPEILPPILKGLADLLASGVDDKNGELKASVIALRKAILEED